MLDTLSWQMQRSGLLTATASLVAQGESIAASSAAGTLADLDLQRFGHFNGATTRIGNPLGNIVSAEITNANSLDRVETIRSDGRIDGADPSIGAPTGRIEVRFADAVLVDQAISGDPCELTFGYTLPTGDSMILTAHAVYLPRPRIEITGPQGVQASFDWQAARDATLGRMATVTLIGKPLILLSAYRSPEHNRAVGGAPASRYMLGTAFDISMSNHDTVAFEAAACGGVSRVWVLPAVRLHAHRSGPSAVIPTATRVFLAP